MIKFQAKELLIIVLITALIIIASLFQTIAFTHTSPPGAVYPFVHGYPPDYYWYLSLIQQGKEGRIFIESRMTPEVFAPQLVNTFFVLLGMVGFLFSAPVLYLVARVIFGILQILAGYILAGQVFHSRRDKFICFLLFFLCVPLWFVDSTGWVHLFGEVWSELDPLVRNAYLPHHMAAVALSIISMVFLWQGIKQNNWRYTVIASICAFAATWSNPGNSIVMGVAVMIGFCLSIRTYRSWLWPVCIYLFGMGLPLVYFQYLQMTVFPWTEFARWERFIFYPIDAVQFLGVLGIPGIIAWCFVPLVLQKKHILWNWIIGWFVSPFLGLAILSRFVPVSNMRYLQGANQIPTAIIASYGIVWISHKIHHQKFQILYWVIMLCLLFGMALPSWYGSVAQQMRSVEGGTYNLLIQVPTVVIDGIQAVSHQGKTGDIVLAPGWISTLIAGLSNKKVMSGHPTFTYDPASKEKDVNAFYTYADARSAKQILQKYHVAYIWIESIHPIPSAFANTLGLKQIYKNPGAEVYAVPK